MNTALWILQGLLAAAFVGAGAGKLAQPRDKLLSRSNMDWVGNYSQGSVWLIGAAEVAGAAGLILPVALNIAPALTPLAALGLSALMGGAVATHVRRSESFTPALVLGVLSLLVFLGRQWVVKA